MSPLRTKNVYRIKHNIKITTNSNTNTPNRIQNTVASISNIMGTLSTAATSCACVIKVDPNNINTVSKPFLAFILRATCRVSSSMRVLTILPKMYITAIKIIMVATINIPAPLVQIDNFSAATGAGAVASCAWAIPPSIMAGNKAPKMRNNCFLCFMFT